MNWDWPKDVKPGDAVIVPIPGKDGKTHDYLVHVKVVWNGESGPMIVGEMPNLPYAAD
jgi:hypothetical protein